MRICLVCSHGGHLTEMRDLEEAFAGHDLCYLTYDSSRTKDLPNALLIQNLWAKPWTIPASMIMIAAYVLKQKPALMISTGAEIAVPAFLIARLAGIKTVFIESCARVSAPSATGKIVYPLSNHFFVQWEGLLRHFGKKARYEGGLL